MLKYLLMRPFALLLLCESQISSQMMVMSDLSNTLMILGLDAIAMLLKIWLFLIMVSTTSIDSEVFVFSI